MMMRILINRIIAAICLFCFSNISFSQGLVENELTTNHIIISKYEQIKSSYRTPSLSDTIILGVKGILDDFSGNGPYPDTAIWLDNKVFINRDFAKAPISLGVATFEGLDYNGFPYDFTAGSTTSAVADFLTSKPIHLNNPPSDSVYLSFFYQPQGNGNAPEYQDSLVVQFKNATSGWKNVWAKRGTTLPATDSSWSLAMIPIADTAYLKDGFQFRFYNRATISGNTDHWNIDYVYLNKTRNINDTTFEDVAFVYKTPPLISLYSAMPWKQYSASDMKLNYTTTIRNNHSVTKNGSFKYKIYNDLGIQVNTTYSGGSFNIDPFSTSGYMNYAAFTNPALNFTIPLLTTASRYTIESSISSTPDNDRGNDTVRFVQDLTNYFSYDDGTAENSFGLSTLYAQLAEKFTLNVADSMQYIDIYFNPFLTNTSIYSFNLHIWTDGGGVPGTVVYIGSVAESPEYGMVMPNQFIRYKLDAPVYLNPGVFYVGFKQNTNQFLNVGVDKNTNTQTKIFYNVTGSWNASPFFGSLMLHPVFGSAAEFTGLTDTETITGKMVVYPNPANNQLFIDGFPPAKKISFTILDLLGKVVIPNSVYTNFIDISILESGVYFIQMKDEENISTVKFIKVN